MPLVAAAPTPRVILGLMTFGTDEATGARITSVPEFAKILDLYQQRGYSEVDTARVYVGGQQEAFTREAGWKERGLTLATKVKYPNAPGENTADKVTASVETSLKELGTDCVDLLYLHAAVCLPCKAILCYVMLCPLADFLLLFIRTAPHPSPRPWRPWTSSTSRASSCAWASPTSPPLRSPRYV